MNMKSALFDPLLRKIYWNLHGFSWDDYLHSTDYQDEIAEITAMVKKHVAVHSPVLLDIGCSTGNFAYAFAEAGFTVTGIDFARNMLRVARNKRAGAQGRKPKFQFGDFTRPLKFPTESFDVVFAAHVFQGVYEGGKLTAELARVIKPSGCLVLVIKRRHTVKSAVHPEKKRLHTPLLRLFRKVFFSGGRHVCKITDSFFASLAASGLQFVGEYDSACNQVRIFQKTGSGLPPSVLNTKNQDN